MRTGIDKLIDGFIRSNMSVEDIINNLVNNYTTRAITEQLVYTTKENAELRERIPSVVRISQEDFDRHFRIIGFKNDGTPETRGANRWKK